MNMYNPVQCMRKDFIKIVAIGKTVRKGEVNLQCRESESDIIKD